MALVAAMGWGFANSKGKPADPPAFAFAPQAGGVWAKHGVEPGFAVDTHTHVHMLDDPVFALAQCGALGVPFVVEVADPTGSAERTYRELPAWEEAAGALLAPEGHRAPRTRISVGIHPHNARKATHEAIERLIRLAADPRTNAIGEIGLDYHYDFSPREVQRDVFARQLVLAQELGLPACLHLREAHDDALEILQREGVPEAGVVVHCFTSGPDVMREFEKLGCYFAFGGAVTFKTADEVRASAALVAPDRLLTETDAPYMAPVPLRGVDCAPAMTLLTLRKLMEVRGIAPEAEETFCAQLAENAFRILDRAPVAWQLDAVAQEATLAHTDGFVSDEDAARYQAEYEANQAAFEAAEREAAEAREREKAARRAKQEAAKAAKAARAQKREEPVRPKALVLVGSPRHGITEQIACEVQGGLADKGVDASVLALAGKRVGPCIECDMCIRIGDDCFQTASDDMAQIDAALDGADFLVMATPIFFAGVPGSLKCVFDRFQPRWSRRYVHGDPMRRKRPVFVLLTGTGHDPYGFDGALLTARSALAIAGFRTDEAAVFLLPGSESSGGHLPSLDTRIAGDARKVGRRIAHLAYESAAGVWERELTAPDVDVHDWNDC